MIREAIARVVEGEVLGNEIAEAAMDAVLSGEATPSQIAGLLIGLRMRGEQAEELAAFARVMRRHCAPVDVGDALPVVDTCGTGGDGSGSFNVSTLAALVVAGCGVTVAKHGNRAMSSRTGSADLLEHLGVRLDLSPAQVGQCIRSVGIGFMFAQTHHPAMRHAGPVRRELGVRTVFNLLGPLTNPAGASHQLLGVYDAAKLDSVAEVLRLLGSQAAWVVHGDGGVDEISPSGPTQVVELRDGRIRRLTVTPGDFGLPSHRAEEIAGGDAARNAEIAKRVLAGEPGAYRDVVVMNAAAVLHVAGKAEALKEAARLAQQALDDGSAATKLRQWVEFGEKA